MIFILGKSMHEQNGTRGIISIFYSNHREAQYPIFSPLYKREENWGQNLRSLLGIRWSAIGQYFVHVPYNSLRSLLKMLTLPSSFLISKVTNDMVFQVYQYFFFLSNRVCPSKASTMYFPHNQY